MAVRNRYSQQNEAGASSPTFEQEYKGRALRLIDKLLLVSELELESTRDETRVLAKARNVYAKESRNIDRSDQK